jgi:hypothetical protein
MSADIEKLAVFDDRIVQSRPRYAVEKGALSVTNSPFNAIAANSSQHTYNVLVPSENIFIDRAVDWTSTAYLQTTLNQSAPLGNAAATRVALVTPGRNVALAPFPLQSMTTTMTATINDTTVTINSADVLPQVLRMTDMRKNRLVRTAPTMLDKYQLNSDSLDEVNSPLNGYETQFHEAAILPNGAFNGLVWTTQDGTPLAVAAAAAGGVYQSGAANGGGWVATTDAPFPQSPLAGTDTAAVAVWNAGAATGAPITVFFSVTSTEKLCLSPFVFNDVHEWDTGLFGCQNIQLVMNFGAQQVGRVLRMAKTSVTVSTAGVLSASGTQFNNAPPSGAFSASRVNIQFLTPSLDVPLPPKSVVPYMEYPRYISSQLSPLLPTAAGAQATVYASQTITLPQIPDLLIIYAKPSTNYAFSAQGSPSFGAPTAGSVGQPDPNQCDWLLPITGISVNFDNFAGLLSSHTQQQLYKMSVHNGLEQDWLSWSGRAWSKTTNPAGGAAALPIPPGLVPTVGGMLVLKPGRDIVLQAGQAPSLVGNFVLQFNLSLVNNSKETVQPQIYVITANSGFFETIKGSSRVVKGVLTEQDIISAPVAPGGTSGSLRRAVGAGVSGSMGNALSALKSMFSPGAAKGEGMKDVPKMPKAGMKGSGAPQQVANALASRLM